MFPWWAWVLVAWIGFDLLVVAGGLVRAWNRARRAGGGVSRHGQS